MRATTTCVLLLFVALGGGANAQQFLKDVISTGNSPANSCDKLDKRRTAFQNTTQKVQTAQETLESCAASGCLPSKLAALKADLDSAKDDNRLAGARLELLSSRFIQLLGEMGTNESPMVDFVLGEKYSFTSPIGKDYDNISSPFPTSIVPSITTSTDQVKRFANVISPPVLDGQDVHLSIIPDTFNNRGFRDYSFAYSLVGHVDAICDAAKSNGGVIFSLADHVAKLQDIPVPLSLTFDVSMAPPTTKYSLYLDGIIGPILGKLFYLSPPTASSLSSYHKEYCPRRSDEYTYSTLSLSKMLSAIARLRQNISASIKSGESWPTPDALFKASEILPVRLAYRTDDGKVYGSDYWTGGIILKIQYHQHIGDLVLIRTADFPSREIQVGIVGVRGAGGEQLYGCDADSVLWPKLNPK